MVGLARGFLATGEANTVVSLWSVDDGSTSALTQRMYKELAATGCTVPEALRLAMLRLGSRLPAHQGTVEPQPESGKQGAGRSGGGLEGEWLVGFRKVEGGSARDAGGGMVPVVQVVVDILEGA